MSRFETQEEASASVDKEQREVTSSETKSVTVRIGGKEYPVIPDKSKTSFAEGVIDFGDDVWWQAEGYVGLYEMSDADLEEMRKTHRMSNDLQVEKSDIRLLINTDGRVRFEYFEGIYEGVMSDERYYGEEVSVDLKSQYNLRWFFIRLREGECHEVPSRIEFYSKGVPATNTPSNEPPIAVYLTKTKEDVSDQFEDIDLTEEPDLQEDEVVCPSCKTKVKKQRFCSECGAPLEQ